MGVCFAAWWPAWQETRDLEWPCESDHFRDMGAAQSILDGQGGADPNFLGYRWWYNPLVPAVVGIVGRALGMPVHQAYGTLGAHLNLVAPFGLYAMMATLFSKRVALTTLIGFLFLGPHRHVSWLHATYSPWLWTCNFAQGLFYLSVLFLVLAFRTRKRLVAIAAGLSVGLTLLAHTAPAVILVVAVVVACGADLRFWRHGRQFAKCSLVIAAIVGVVAGVTASPFALDALLHLQDGVRNRAPMQWVAGELSLQHLPRLVKWHFSVRGYLAMVGLLHLLLRPRAYCRYGRRMVMGWGLAVTLGLAYGYASQRIALPAFLPSWHFYFYLHALESVLFGIGTAVLAATFVRFVIRWPQMSKSARSFELGTHLACIAWLLLYAGGKYERYRLRMDVVDNRHASVMSSQAPTAELYEWLLNHTKPTDVVLSDMEASFYAVVAAGRKVVATYDLFSNPYLDPAPRAIDAVQMLEHLKTGRWSEFLSRAEGYQLRYVALPAADREKVKAGEGAGLLRVFATSDADRGIDVYELSPRTRIP